MECTKLDPYGPIYTKEFVKKHTGYKLGNCRPKKVLQIAKDNIMIPTIKSVASKGSLGSGGYDGGGSKAINRGEILDIHQHSYNGRATNAFYISWKPGSTHLDLIGKKGTIRQCYVIQAATTTFEIDRKTIYRKFSVYSLSLGCHQKKDSSKWSWIEHAPNKMDTLVDCALEIEINAFLKTVSDANLTALKSFDEAQKLNSILICKTDKDGKIKQISEDPIEKGNSFMLKKNEFKLKKKEVLYEGRKLQFLVWKSKGLKRNSVCSFQDALRLGVISKTVNDLAAQWGFSIKEFDPYKK